MDVFNRAHLAVLRTVDDLPAAGSCHLAGIVPAAAQICVIPLMDIGCGTGVLALAGLKLGAQRAISFDFDPVAVEVARRNIERNGGADNLSLFQADVFEWKPAQNETSDIVLANLFSAVLVKAFPQLIAAMKPEGAILIISGILNTQAEETLLAAQQAGLKILKVVSRGKWTTAKLTNL